MASIDSLNRRIDRLNAVANPSKLRVIFRDPNGELPADIDADDDDVLIITWKVGEGDEAAPTQMSVDLAY